MPRSDTVVIALVVLSACVDGTLDPVRGPSLADTGDSGAPADPPTGGLLVPASGTWFGASIDLHTDSMSSFDERLGHDAADFVVFVDFPLDGSAEASLDDFLQRATDHRAMALVTFEPQVPLGQITPAMATRVADVLAGHEAQGGPGVLVRFAHEMNGSWYSWGQQPSAYVAAFRTVAEAIHGETSTAAMLWAPSYGGGYPYGGGAYLARPGDPGFDLLDTDHDGALTGADDPYGPYWPGDAFVDWVGLSLYHWGSRWPWGANEVPEPHKFLDELTGTYDGLGGDQRSVPDFYQVFAVGHGKPLAIAETGAFYDQDRGGPSELSVKSPWWTQVFAPEVFDAYPRVRLINWFEIAKRSPEAGGDRIDWTVTVDPDIRRAFLADLPVERLVFAPPAGR